jgi:hypothetical protein
MHTYQCWVDDYVSGALSRTSTASGKKLRNFYTDTNKVGERDASYSIVSRSSCRKWKQYTFEHKKDILNGVRFIVHKICLEILSTVHLLWTKI